MFARFLGRGTALAAVLSLGLALGLASPALAQGPGATRPKAPNAHAAKGHHGAKHRHKHRHGHKATTVEQARKKVERQSQQVRNAMMKLSEARRELASFSGRSGSRTTSNNPFRGGSTSGFGGAAGGFGGGIAGPAGFGGGMTAGRAGGGVASFRGSFGGMGGQTSSMTMPSRATSSTQDIAQLKKDVAELRDTVNKLAEIVKNRR